jgi:hypothetical protein
MPALLPNTSSFLILVYVKAADIDSASLDDMRNERHIH